MTKSIAAALNDIRFRPVYVTLANGGQARVLDYHHEGCQLVLEVVDHRGNIRYINAAPSRTAQVA
jgi:hypothetical protein